MSSAGPVHLVHKENCIFRLSSTHGGPDVSLCFAGGRVTVRSNGLINVLSDFFLPPPRSSGHALRLRQRTRERQSKWRCDIKRSKVQQDPHFFVSFVPNVCRVTPWDYILLVVVFHRDEFSFLDVVLEWNWKLKFWCNRASCRPLVCFFPNPMIRL